MSTARARAKAGAKASGAAQGESGGSAQKVLRVLMSFSQDAPRHTAEDLARATDLPLSSTYRYLTILREAGLIEEDGRGAFTVSPLVIGLARAAQAASSLVETARPHMETLSAKSHETVILVRRSGDQAVCIQRVESSQRIRMSFDVGTALPLHAGASPKVLLAGLEAGEREAILAEFEARYPELRDRLAALRGELGAIASEGWAQSTAEITSDVYAVAAPVHAGRETVAALSIVAPAFRVSAEERGRLRELVIGAARDLSRAFSRTAL